MPICRTLTHQSCLCVFTIESARSVLNRPIPDIYLHLDVHKRPDSGNSPGYALSLLTESTTGAALLRGRINTSRDAQPISSRKCTRSAARRRWYIRAQCGREKRAGGDYARGRGRQGCESPVGRGPKGGCVYREHQWLVLLFMALGSEDVGRVRMGEPSPRM